MAATPRLEAECLEFDWQVVRALPLLAGCHTAVEERCYDGVTRNLQLNGHPSWQCRKLERQAAAQSAASNNQPRLPSPAPALYAQHGPDRLDAAASHSAMPRTARSRGT